MEQGTVSRTALMMAFVRGCHAANDSPVIFDDFLAHKLFNENELKIIEQHLAGFIMAVDPALAASCKDHTASLYWSMRVFAGSILARARYAEDRLEEAVRRGMSQYVIMGAGMDTFAFRRPELVEKLQIFEMDQPATQGFKRHRITELGWEIPAGLHFVPVDFTRESLAEALSRSAYNPRSQSFFSWLGVTHYLPREAVSATLRSISGAAPAGSLVVFDYYDTDAFIPEKASQRVQAILKLTRGIGEPVNTGFDPSTLAASLAHLGLHLLDDLGPADIQERFFQGRTDDYFAYEHVHYACAAVK